MAIYIRILRYVKPYKNMVFVALVLSLIFGAANTYLLPTARDLTNELANKNSWLFLNQVLNVFLLFAIRESTKQLQFYLITYLYQIYDFR